MTAVQQILKARGLETSPRSVRPSKELLRAFNTSLRRWRALIDGRIEMTFHDSFMMAAWLQVPITDLVPEEWKAEAAQLTSSMRMGS